MDRFPHLMNEIECINRSYGWVGLLDACEFISRHEDEYIGTACYADFRRFMREMGRLFAPVENELTD